jgi:hypothetical protein
MKPLCLDGDAPQFAVRRDEGWEQYDSRRVVGGVAVGTALGVVCWALILLGLAWLAGWVP